MNSDRALELAREAYPHNHVLRVAFMLGCNKGYEQAEKDLALTWEDIKKIMEAEHEVFIESHKPQTDKEYFYKVLRKFLKSKKEVVEK